MKNKFYLLLLALAFMFPVASFSACGPTESTTPTEETTPSNNFTDFTVTYKNGATTLHDGMTVEFTPALNLTASDFELTLNDTQQTKITSNISFRVYKLENGQRVEAQSYELGTYIIKFTYGNIEKEFTFNVVPAMLNFNNVVVSGLDESYPYDANGVFPEPTFSYGNVLLVKDVDYVLTYGENNTSGENAGTIIISPAGNYQASSEIVYYFNIEKLTPEQIIFENKSLTYTGQDQANELTVDVNDYKGISAVNFTFYKNDQIVWELRDVGTYVVVANFFVEDGYNELESKEFLITIQPKDISNTDITSVGLGSVSRQFKNSAFTADDFFEEVQTALNHSQFEISMSSGVNVDNINASTSQKTGKFVVNGTNNYYGSFEVPYTIARKVLSDNITVNLNDSTPYVYDGSQKLLRTVHYYMNNDYVLLVDGQDYDITFTSSNILAGTCNYRIEGKGNYTGIFQGNFTIFKKQISLETPTWSATELTYNQENQLDRVYITNLPDYVIATYTSYSEYNEYTQTYTQQALVNAGYYKVLAELSFSVAPATSKDEFGNDYATNYELTYPTTYIQEVIINKAIATATFNGPSSKVYDGEAYLPENIIVNATIDGQQKALVKDEAYTLVYPENPVNVYHTNEYDNIDSFYQMNVELTNANYIFDLGNESTSFPLYYQITPKTLTLGAEENATIVWPVVYKNLWTYNYLLDKTNAYLKDTELDKNVDVRFWIANNNTICAELESYSNYEITIENQEIIPANVEIRNNIFEFIKINNTALSTNEIENLTTVNWGDKIEISCLNGYNASYILLASGSFVRYANEQSLSSIAGKETYGVDVYDENDNTTIIHYSTDKYEESDIRICVYSSEDSSLIIAGKEIAIIRGALFDELTIASTNCVPTAGYKDGYLNNLNTIFLAETGDTIVANLNSEYAALYDVLIVEIQGTTESTINYNPSTGYEIDFSSIDSLILKVINKASNAEIIFVNINKHS